MDGGRGGMRRKRHHTWSKIIVRLSASALSVPGSRTGRVYGPAPPEEYMPDGSHATITKVSMLWFIDCYWTRFKCRAKSIPS